MKIKQIQKILKTNLRLLVMLRESLEAEGAKESPLYAAVAAQAQATGFALPNEMRLTKEEIAAFRRRAVAATMEQTQPAGDNNRIIAAGSIPGPQGPPVLPGPGQFSILTDKHLKR